MGGHIKDEPEKLKYVWELASMFASKETQQRYAYDCGNIPVRNDVELETDKMSPLLADLLTIKENDVKVWGSVPGLTTQWQYWRILWEKHLSAHLPE